MTARRLPITCTLVSVLLICAIFSGWRAAQARQQTPKGSARRASAPTQSGSATIIRTLVFRQLSRFTGGGPAIDKLKLSADGSKLIFAGNDKKVYTINADGTGFTQVFDYTSLGPPRIPFANVEIDLSANGSRIIWSDGVGEIFVANFDGSNRQRIATALPRPSGGTEGPSLFAPLRITADGARIYFSTIQRRL